MLVIVLLGKTLFGTATELWGIFPIKIWITHRLSLALSLFISVKPPAPTHVKFSTVFFSDAQGKKRGDFSRNPFCVVSFLFLFLPNKIAEFTWSAAVFHPAMI